MNLAATCKNSWRLSAEIVDVHQTPWSAFFGLLEV